MTRTEWSIHGRELVNCNCAYGCPCQFNALPTHGNCRAIVGYQIDTGHYGVTKLDGVRTALVASWPGPIHEGDGTMQFIIDETASDAQRAAMEAIMRGDDTDDMATMWWVFSAMAPRKLDTIYAPIDFAVDVDARRGHLRIPNLIEMTGEPIKNPVTGAEHRARIDLPHGFEYRLAEIGSASGKSTAGVAMELTDSYAQFAEIHLCDKGVIEAAAA